MNLRSRQLLFKNILSHNCKNHYELNHTGYVTLAFIGEALALKVTHMETLNFACSCICCKP
jgi:hypothetical protein